MSVDWIHADAGTAIDFADMPEPGGQYTRTVPANLASVVGTVSIHTDNETDDKYVQVGGSVSAHGDFTGEIAVYYPDYPDWNTGEYWPYRFTGWPILAAIPGDFYNAEISPADPVHQYGGQVIQSAMAWKYDPDWTGPTFVENYNPNYDPPITEALPHLQPGSGGPGGTGDAGGYIVDDEGGYAVDQSVAWNYVAVSQRCWVLILADPSGHRVYHDPNVDIDPEYVSSYDGRPVVFNPVGLTFFFFSMAWKLGYGSGQPGVRTAGTQGSIPTTINVNGS